MGTNWVTGAYTDTSATTDSQDQQGQDPWLTQFDEMNQNPQSVGEPTQTGVTDTGQINPSFSGGRVWGGNWTQEGASTELQRLYQANLGRQASEEELQPWLTQPGGHAGAVTGIQGSDEAKAWTAAQQAQAKQAQTQAQATSQALQTPNAALPGWDQTKWNDPSHQSTKYVAGRILAKYPGTSAGLAQAWPEIQAAFPNATFDGKDKIDFGDGFGPIDVLQSAGAGGAGFWWGAGGGGGGGAQGAALASALGSYGSMGTTGAGSTDLDAFAQQFKPYDPYQFTQYQAPQMGAYEDQTLKALSQALGSSEWSPERVAAQKETQKEQALSMQDQLAQQLGDRYAGMGRLGSGQYGTLRAQLGADTASEILGSYRDIEENAANARRAELLNTAQALNEAMTSAQGRSSQAYATGLTGQGAQADEGYRAWESQFPPYELALQKSLGEQGIGAEWGRIGASREATQLANDLALRQLEENIRQFNEDLGFRYSGLNFNILGL